MKQRRNRYQQMEQLMTYILIGALGLFILYLIFAACGIIWLKVILSILLILTLSAVLAFMYMTGELLKRRSLWITTGAAAILVCLLFSLMLNYPR
ncbi:MAG: hypothetical protein IJW41_03085 [Oscillospiraceae bacterium]|nr:hypothetical protein [Oscillospiraceae bacterium]